MDTNDEYIVYIRKDGSRFYLKNKAFHRESGPAIVIAADKDRYSNLGDENLYKKSYKPIEWEENDDNRHLDKLMMFTYFFESQYALNGIKYSEQEFNAIMLNQQLQDELHKSASHDKKVKI